MSNLLRGIAPLLVCILLGWFIAAVRDPSASLRALAFMSVLHGLPLYGLFVLSQRLSRDRAPFEGGTASHLPTKEEYLEEHHESLDGAVRCAHCGGGVLADDHQPETGIWVTYSCMQCRRSVFRSID